ncbi:sensor histidine kinase [Winogradskya humida]|uniref:sensor histidine kinase n=1 Tax=Winogradskya humida TaxID=113566 RepID=UPI001EF22456|nr:HAMP domain-containing sensor histidine kinase [Actinoplanes humidus]
MRRVGTWWGRRTLHARLSLLVTGAVALAVLVVAGLAWATVAEIQHRQLQNDLTSDATTIAADPAQWLATGPVVEEHRGGPGPPRRFRRDAGPRWQILDAQGGVRNKAGIALPVTPGAREVAAGRRVRAEEQVTVGAVSYQMVTVPIAGGGAVQVAVNRTPGDRTLVVFAIALLACCAVGIAGAAVLGRTVARAGLRPVQRLTGAVEEVAVTMDLTRPIPINGADEIARLAGSVNTLLTAIDTARTAQRTLVEDAGHELRTPLTSIRTNIELLLEVERHPELAHRLPPEDRTKLLHDLDAQVTELATLTTELVELARDETTREDVEPVDLTAVTQAALTRVRIRAPGLTFTTSLTPCTVQGRPGELERMILNVLDNAAKWSPAGATVHTGLRTDETGRCELTVTDTGPGIAEADRPHIFDRFYRATAARSMPGSGLGLAIVAQTAEQHGGTVQVEPNVPHGTRVVIRLPATDGTGDAIS